MLFFKPWLKNFTDSVISMEGLELIKDGFLQNLCASLSHRQLYVMVPFYICDHMINLCIIFYNYKAFQLTHWHLIPLYHSHSYAKWIIFICIYCWCCMFPQANFFVLELKNGFLRLMYDFGFTNGPVVMESNLAKLHINDARYHEVLLCWGHSSSHTLS